MIRFYRWLLKLYPSAYRREYADEMVLVFQGAQVDAGAGSFRTRISFRSREIRGLLAGAVHEHLHIIRGTYPSISFTRFDMRPEFRFPRSTVFLMSLVFAMVIFAMEKANTIQIKYGGGADSIWPSLPWFLGLTVFSTCATVTVIWGILFALGRTGAHRLANMQPGPKD